MLQLPSEQLVPDQLRRLEWIEPDGLGGFAMGTAAMHPTRRYHGLLTHARRPPIDRRLLLAGLEEQLEGSEVYRLDSAEYAQGEAPEGDQWLIEMAIDPFPRFRYRLGGHLVERILLVPRGVPAILVRYRHLEGPEPLDFLVSPLLAGRSFHDLLRANDLASLQSRTVDGDLVLRPYPEELPVHVRESGWTFHEDPSWVEGVLYQRERARGYQYREDLLRPGHLEFRLEPGEDHLLLFSVGPLAVQDPEELVRREETRRQTLYQEGREAGEVGGLLALATDRFLVSRAEGGPSLLAGYPWFEDWGRDTFLSLPGVAPKDGSPLAAEVLETFAAHEAQGLIPNRFGDRPGETAYNAADASLWFVVEYERLRRGRSDPGSDTLWKAVRSIFLNYLQGTRFGIRVDPEDGLLSASARGLQLTWMDAKVDGLVVTPRAGKPVELQGLWYFCCKTVVEQARLRGEDELAVRAEEAARRVEENFHRLFWVPSRGHYGDCISPQGSLDRSLRPNQILSMALRFRLIDSKPGRRLLKAVDQSLLTPYGLRTLAPSETGYRGRYEGSVLERDLAYHQGTVWPWLLGPYGMACLSYRGEDERPRLQAILQPLLDFLAREGLGNLPEVFDGDPPHRPGGCPAQAWSAAQIRRLYLVLQHQDRYDPVEI